MNKVVLMGRITNDLELKTSANGESYLFLTLAINEPSSTKSITQFIPCVAFKKTAALISQYLKKGDPLLIEGSIDFKRRVGKDGLPTNSFNVIINKIYFISNKSTSNRTTSSLNDYENNFVDKTSTEEVLDIDEAIFWED